MGRITALQVKRSNKRVNVFIDGSFSLALDGDVAARENLQIGRHLSAGQVEKMKQADLLQNCYKAALHYLGYRPRSETEVRQRLRRRSFDADVVDKVITDLKERKLIDDVAFAGYWRDNRLSFKPRSRKLIKLELRQKGIVAEMASEAVKDLDDEFMAYEAGLKKARVLTSLDYSEFRRRLSGYLQRRGFNYEIIKSVIVRLWQERQIGSA